MLLKVKYDELKEVANTTNNDSSLLSEEIKKLLEQIEKLKSIWQGVDADAFYGNAYDYFQKMTTVYATLNNLGRFIDNVNNKYKNSDETFSRELDTEVDNYEENINNWL